MSSRSLRGGVIKGCDLHAEDYRLWAEELGRACDWTWRFQMAYPAWR